jgi:hypothetical protein
LQIFFLENVTRHEAFYNEKKTQQLDHARCVWFESVWSILSRRHHLSTTFCKVEYTTDRYDSTKVYSLAEYTKWMGKRNESAMFPDFHLAWATIINVIVFDNFVLHRMPLKIMWNK